MSRISSSVWSGSMTGSRLTQVAMAAELASLIAAIRSNGSAAPGSHRAESAGSTKVRVDPNESPGPSKAKSRVALVPPFVNIETQWPARCRMFTASRVIPSSISSGWYGSVTNESRTDGPGASRTASDESRRRMLSRGSTTSWNRHLGTRSAAGA